MGRLRSLLLCCVLFVVSGSSLVAAEAAPGKSDQNRQRRQEIEEQLKLAKASDAGVEAEVARLSKAVAGQQAKADQARQAQAVAQKAADGAAAALADIELRTVKVKDNLARRAVEAYIHPSGGGGFFALTKSESFDVAVRRQGYLTMVQGRTIDAVGALRSVREDQADAKTAFDDARDVAGTRAKAEKTQADILVVAQRSQQAARLQLQGRITALEQESGQLAAQEPQVQAIIRAETATPPPSSPSSGSEVPRPAQPKPVGRPSSSGFVWPISGVVTSEYGPRWGSFHPGIDIAGPNGAPIAAARSGEVIYAAFNEGGYGNYVIIDHGDGFVTAYAHQSRLAVRKGDTVSQGQVIGYEGSTGFSTGPHLHFEVRTGGSARDPRGFVNGNP